MLLSAKAGPVVFFIHSFMNLSFFIHVCITPGTEEVIKQWFEGEDDRRYIIGRSLDSSHLQPRI